jgi:hypothetical protein
VGADTSISAIGTGGGESFLLPWLSASVCLCVEDIDIVLTGREGRLLNVPSLENISLVDFGRISRLLGFGGS